MVISSTSAVEVSIHAVSPLLILSAAAMNGLSGAGGAAAGAAAASALGGSAFASGAGAAEAGAGAVAAGGAAFWSAALSCAIAAVDTLKAPIRAINANNRFMRFPLKRFRAGLAGRDAHDL